MSNELYIIVHEDLMRKNHNLYTDDKVIENKLKEIERIKKEEDFRKVDGHPREIPKNLSRDKKIFVCGAYDEWCVKQQKQELLENGFATDIYYPATISFCYILVKLLNSSAE